MNMTARKLEIVVDNTAPPDWLVAADKYYLSQEDITYLHNYKENAHLVVCGYRKNFLSHNKETRNLSKRPLNLPELRHNIYCWSENPVMEKVDLEQLLNKVSEGHSLAYIPGSFGLICLDVDNNKYKEVIDEAGEPICVLSTPSGGKHLLYKKPDGLQSIPKQKISDFIDGAAGEIIDNTGCVMIYQPNEMAAGLKSDKSDNKLNEAFLERILGGVFDDADNNNTIINWKNPSTSQRANYPIDEGTRLFAKSKEGSRNDDCNKYVFRDAYYGLLDDDQRERYIEGAKKNGLPIKEVISILENATKDAEAARIRHNDKFGIMPYHSSSRKENSQLEFDNTNPLDRERIISEVIHQAQYRVRSDTSYFKFNASDAWIKFDDTCARRINKRLADEGYYTPGKHKDKIVDLSIDEINGEMAQMFKDNEFDSVKHYFESLKNTWDGQERIGKLMNELFLCEHTPLLEYKTKLFLCGLVNRVYNPGCKFDAFIFFRGRQGIGKSSWTRYLFPPRIANDAVSANISLRLGLQQMLEAAGGSCILLFDEAISKQHKERENLKALISATRHRYRKPYCRVAEDILASYIMIGTTNSDEFLTNDVENRRFIVFNLDPDEKLDTQRNGFKIEKYLDKNRDQIFAEVLYLLDNGFDFTFSGEFMNELNKEREIFRQRDSKYESIVSTAIQEKVLYDKCRWTSVLWEAGLLQVRSGVGKNEAMDTDLIRKALSEGETLSKLNLVQSGTSFDRDNLKQALLHFGFKLKKGRAEVGIKTPTSILININK